MLCGLQVRHIVAVAVALDNLAASTNVIWHWNWFCHGKTDECDAGGAALKRAVDVRVFSSRLFR
jgi:hypothetical protein